jgi:hypothetical protein
MVSLSQESLPAINIARSKRWTDIHSYDSALLYNSISIYISILVALNWSLGYSWNALFLILRESVGLLGRGINRHTAPTYIEQHKHRINADKHPCLMWDSNPRSQHLSNRRHFMPHTARPLWLGFGNYRVRKTKNTVASKKMEEESLKYKSMHWSEQYFLHALTPKDDQCLPEYLEWKNRFSGKKFKTQNVTLQVGFRFCLGDCDTEERTCFLCNISSLTLHCKRLFRCTMDYIFFPYPAFSRTCLYQVQCNS